MLTAKNSPWTLLSVLCTESALTYMRKEENSEIKKTNISICLSFSTVLAAPLDQTWFSPLQTQIWHQDGLYPLTWKSVTILHLFIIIHTYRSNTKLENTHALLDLPWKKIKRGLLNAFSEWDWPEHSIPSVAAETQELWWEDVAATQQHRTALSGFSSMNLKLLGAFKLAELYNPTGTMPAGFTCCSWKVSHWGFNHHKWQGLNFSSHLKYARAQQQTEPLIKCHLLINTVSCFTG